MAKNYKRRKKQAERAIKEIKKLPTWVIITAIVLVIAIIVGYYAYVKFVRKDEETLLAKGEFSVHFLTLGNDASGDCTYIKAGENDILIDAGSTAGSISTIKSYLSNYVKDNKIEYVIATHGDSDHIAGFADDDGIFSLYKCGIIIDFPKTTKIIKKNNTETYNNYIENRNSEVNSDGATYYNALDCYNNVNGASREYSLGENMKMEILYNYYYENSTNNENDYSVCVMFYHGDRKFLFTGDLEKSGEEKLAEKYDFTQVELYKAGHHGSRTASNDVLLREIKPKICVINCVADDRYGFPHQEFINRISQYTTSVYMTSMGNENYTGGSDYSPFNGNVVVLSNEQGVSVSCSNNSGILKDSEWFTKCRTLPSYWIS